MSSPLHKRARGARILLVDNYSSFTYNLFQYLAELSGQAPYVLRNDAELPAGLRFSDFDAAVLSPGPGQPSRVRDFGICARVLEERELFVLGVCLGHEGLGLQHGARVTRAREAFHGRASRIRHGGDELFAGIPEEFLGVRYHSLAVEEPLPAVLRAIARTTDGELMAMRHASLPHWGVQFHPESAETEYGKELLANFCALALASVKPGRTSANQAEPPGRSSPPAGPSRRSWTVLRHGLATERSCAQIFRCLYGASMSAFWLDGGADQTRSYLGDASGPHAYQLDYSLSEKTIRCSGAKEGTQVCTSVFDYLQEELVSQCLKEQRTSPESAQFQGGFVGYLGYELKAECGSSNSHTSRLPDAHWIFCDRFVVYEHSTRSAELVALVPEGGSDAAAQRWFQECIGKLAAAAVVPERSRPRAAASGPAPRWRDSRSEYLHMVRRCQEEILAGESYELCLTTRAEVHAHVDGLALFEDMRASNPAPYAAYLQCGAFALASASPERFLKVDGQGQVESKPIKGTARRGLDASTDAELGRTLMASFKERAENLMIVDLVRNDLGRSCEIGSVVVDSFAALESYATVHQLVSTISGRLRKDVSALACARAAFPGGSMTGAPKLRSMEILDALEADARGPYSGSIGYLSLCGSLDLSIVIRTVLIEDGRVSVGVGGAVTSLSSPEDEYDEVLLKAIAPLAAIGRVGG